MTGTITKHDSRINSLWRFYYIKKAAPVTGKHFLLWCSVLKSLFFRYREIQACTGVFFCFRCNHMHHVKKIAVWACYKANIFMICWKFHQHRQNINIWGYPQFWGHPRQAIFHRKSIRTKNWALIISFGGSESPTLDYLKLTSPSLDSLKVANAKMQALKI